MPNTLGDYTFIITDLLTGFIIDEVELSSMNWDEVYNRPGAGSATARLDDPKTTEANFSAWQNALWAIKDGDIRWCGFMGNVAPRGGSRVINVPLYGFEEYLRYQLVVNQQNMSYATSADNFRTTKWSQIDQFQIVEDLVKHGQRNSIQSNIGLEVVYDQLSGVLRDETISQWNAKFVGERIEELTDNIDGFDWYYEYYWDGTTPKVRMRLKYPRGPRYTNVFLEYDNDPGNTNIVQYDVDGGDRPASRMLGLGAGEDLDQVYAFSSEVKPGNVNYDDVYSNLDVTDVNTLQQQIDGIRLTRDKVRNSIQIVLDQNLDPHYTTYRPGDALKVRIDDGFVQIDGFYTTVSKSIVLSKEHDEVVTVSLLDVLVDVTT